jgi:hypothetical protein
MSIDAMAIWKARDPSYEVRVRESVARPSRMAMLGAPIAFIGR